jgi:hypothetical protein
MLSLIELEKYKELFFNYGYNLKSIEKDFQYTSLAKFILNWRNTNVKSDDPLLEDWINKIAPSCVYQNDSVKMGESFKCVLCSTVKEFKKAAHLVRHYRESHLEEIPKDIFGELVTYKCEPCELTFIRKEYLTQHLSSAKHFKVVEPNKIRPTKRCNQLAKEIEIYKKRSRDNENKNLLLNESSSSSIENEPEDNNLNDEKQKDKFEKETPLDNSSEKLVIKNNEFINCDTDGSMKNNFTLAPKDNTSDRMEKALLSRSSTFGVISKSPENKVKLVRDLSFHFERNFNF